MSRGGPRYGVYVHDPEGDMGYGVIVGAFKAADGAERKADAIRRTDERLECIVLPLWPGSDPASNIADYVAGSGGYDW